jgi:uncharacterized protein YlaI
MKNTNTTKPIIKKASEDIKYCNCCKANEIIKPTDNTYYEIDFNNITVYLCQDCKDELKTTFKKVESGYEFCNCCGSNEAINKTDMTYYELDLKNIGVFLCDNCADELKANI